MILKALQDNAENKSVRYYARYIADTLESVGFKFKRQASAYQYNNVLGSIGFNKIASGTTLEQAQKNKFDEGDIIVFDKTDKRIHGHIEMRSNNIWVSDFRQKNFCPYVEMLSWVLWRYEPSPNIDRFQQAIDA